MSSRFSLALSSMDHHQDIILKGKKRVVDVMPIATGHEREELEAELEGRNVLEMNYPVGPFGTKLHYRISKWLCFSLYALFCSSSLSIVSMLPQLFLLFNHILIVLIDHNSCIALNGDVGICKRV
ncbi:hypothetical protein LOK49_LG09G01789 [Camellia lanceoleosa]|uniref:Uncharacterized protein n=1 Tax=Camellia lanceoleosa TaxID=1840588 RepID=A0ACC0GL02_9ERIC|nr:hypothetical protein LOK49_LG09G01789 [Camellia lanceoleosa]